MGQYHLTINLDKKEFIYPHKIGLGLKLMEQCGFAGSTGDILFLLLACSNGRGGGDCETQYPKLIGRWAGDRIAVIGDYCQETDIPGVNAEEIQEQCRSTGLNGDKTAFTDISDELIPLINEQFGCHIDPKGEGWRNRDIKPPMRPDMLLGVDK